MMPWIWLLACRGGVTTTVSLPHTHVALVDDFRPKGPNGEDLGRSRMDTAREFFGNTNRDGDFAIFNPGNPGGGVRFAMPMSTDLAPEGVSVDQLLGPTLNFDVQPTLEGIQLLLSGSGAITARLEAPDGTELWTQTQGFVRRDDKVIFDVDLPEPIKIGGFSVELIRGFAEVRRVELLLNERRPFLDAVDESFVYSYAQLSRCWDDTVGLVRAQCGPQEDPVIYAPDATGLFALATAVGSDLGYVPEAVARSIILSSRDALLALPRDPVAGLLPDQTDGTSLAAGGTWSSLATAVALESTMLAAQAFELRTADLQGALEDVVWDELTTNGGQPISGGFDSDNQAVSWDFGVFGSKSVLLQVAHVGATGNFAPMNLPFTPTWDGAGWDNELAALFFPMDRPDWNGNDWVAWRSGAHWQHHTWSRDTPAGKLGLFGLSTAEVPEPWQLDGYAPSVSDWGVGGHNLVATDGLEAVGYSFYAPHYAAMVVGEFPKTAGVMLETLLDRNLLTAFNAVESVGTAEQDVIRFNHRLRAWTLSLQTLGLGRALSGDGYLPYRLLDELPFLRDGHQTVLPLETE
ncbi:MAG: hypothetical protein AAGA48_01620 [Myxococcota bacterium]